MSPHSRNGDERAGDGGPAGSANRPRRILVVDENADAASCLARLLARRGHEVLIAPGPATALELARWHRPEVVLVDVGRPDTPGYQLAERLRNDECGREALLIAVSGYPQPDRRDARPSGFDHHLVKPMDFEAFVALIARD